MENYGDLLIKLINLSIFDKKLSDWPESLDYEKFAKFCKFHKLENIAYNALKQLNIAKENLKFFEEYYSFNLFVITKQQIYLQMIKNAFDENGIEYLILKGAELSSLYPASDMRLSTDIDIYIGDNAEKCKPIMEKLGFIAEAFNEENDEHDVYKLDCIYCELHPALIQGEYAWKDACNSITDRLVKSSGMEVKMSPEDFYVYNLAHAAKHMKFSGVGIKVFLDLELIVRKKDIDWNIVDERLKEANLYEFNASSKELCEYWFSDLPLNDKLDFTKEYVYSSGFCGTVLQRKSSDFSNQKIKTNNVFLARVSKCFEVLKLPYSDYARKYPVLKKHKFLTPLFRIYRLISAVLFKRKTVKKVWKQFDGVDVEYSNNISNFKKSIGL